MIFGVHAGLQNTSTDDIQALWRRVETLGFGWISVWDHFYAADVTEPESGYECLEAVTAHAALAMATSTVRCGSLVYCAGYRHPAVMANVDRHHRPTSPTAGSRSAWVRAGTRANTTPTASRSRPHRCGCASSRNRCSCIRALLTEDVVDFDGEFYQSLTARCVPKPEQARLPIWLGGHGEKVTLKLVARHADGWNVPFVDVETFRHKVTVLERHCADAGRDPAPITKSLNLALAWNEEDLVAQFGNMVEFLRRFRPHREHATGRRPDRRLRRRRGPPDQRGDAGAIRRRRHRTLRRRGPPAIRVTATPFAR